MALANIRERLQLHFDVEASLTTRVNGGRYEIDIVMPFRTAP
jgi:two-component system sensor histidine kinase AlgZ